MEKTLHTYAELNQWVEPFFQKDGPQLVILVSDPGKGKSELVKAMAKRASALYCKASQLTEFQFYKLCYAHRNENLILDDIETLLEKTPSTCYKT
jgi:hypothetical protein